jgi:hypothetical protein
VRRRLDGTALVAAVAGSALFFRLLLVDLAVSLSPAAAGWRFLVAGVVAVGTVAGGVLVAVLGRCWRERSVEPFYRPAYVPAYAVALFVAFGTATVLADAPDVVVDALWTASAAAAAVGYERTRSLWPPVFALAGVELALVVAPAV